MTAMTAAAATTIEVKNKTKVVIHPVMSSEPSPTRQWWVIRQPLSRIDERGTAQFCTVQLLDHTTNRRSSSNTHGHRDPFPHLSLLYRDVNPPNDPRPPPALGSDFELLASVLVVLPSALAITLLSITTTSSLPTPTPTPPGPACVDPIITAVGGIIIFVPAEKGYPFARGPLISR